jgi:hypothetical protein
MAPETGLEVTDARSSRLVVAWRPYSVLSRMTCSKLTRHQAAHMRTMVERRSGSHAEIQPCPAPQALRASGALLTHPCGRHGCAIRKAPQNRESKLNENLIPNADPDRCRKLRLGKTTPRIRQFRSDGLGRVLAHRLPNRPGLCGPGGLGASQGAGSGQRDDGVAGMASTAVPGEEGLTSRRSHARAPTPKEGRSP